MTSPPSSTVSNVSIASSLKLAVKLLASFGFSSGTLKANSVLIPVTHYLHDRSHDESYLTTARWRDDRDRLRTWVIRSLVKPGIWGSGLDTLLKSLRAVVRDTEEDFPVRELETAMARQGKSLAIDAAVLDDLVELPYKDKRTFAVLALLYPGIDVRNEFHIDHVFPKSLFTPRRLAAAGIPPDLVPEFRARFDLLPNLQLLEGPVNEAKRNKLPHGWALTHMPNEAARAGWLAMHDLHDLPVDLDDFLELYESRRIRIRSRLAAVLRSEVPPVVDTPPPDPNAAEPVRPDLPVEDAAPAGPRSFGRSRYSVGDLVRMGLLAAGTPLHGTHRGVTYRVSVGPDGALVTGTERFATPSQAAAVLSDQAAVNGWRFWRLPDGTELSDLRPEV